MKYTLDTTAHILLKVLLAEAMGSHEIHNRLVLFELEVGWHEPNGVESSQGFDAGYCNVRLWTQRNIQIN